MTSDPKKPTPPEGLPDQLVLELHQLNAQELRKTIIHAQELLSFQNESPSPVEPNPGDDILQVTEHDGYTEVVKRVFCSEGCDDCPHGPYHYYVTQEHHPNGTEKPYWRFIGKIELDDE
ncbi:hypothetical protein [Natronorubrum thiooxidans]|uniref:hypothetical protein n=1 Tax=Natronorubrum thiooxidans TaxID=308853 RepID=UPI0009715B80|nr:hypothetical protein [Natronorubrum thiooxidans]